MSLPAYCNAEAWRPIDLPISKDLRKEPDFLDRILDLLHVEEAERYQPTDKQTFCNILAWDVSRAWGAEVPHWYDYASGDATPVGAKGSLEMSANRMYDWLCMSGLERGWGMSAKQEDAVKWAREKKLVLAIWKNRAGVGHVAIVLPDGNAAQAGRHCYRRAPLARCFGDALPNVKFFCHA